MTGHIKATRALLVKHIESCPYCRQYSGDDWPDCEQGAVLLDEYRQAILINPNCEKLIAKEPICETTTTP